MPENIFLLGSRFLFLTFPYQEKKNNNIIVVRENENCIVTISGKLFLAPEKTYL